MQICRPVNMEKYPLSILQQTLIDWKYERKHAHETKTYELKHQANGNCEITLKNQITIINNGGTFKVKMDPVTFRTTSVAMESLIDGSEMDALKNFLREFDSETYIKAEESENDTTHQVRFFEK
jgi:hypothetical protein